MLGNDTDVDGDPLTAVLVSGPANGTLTLNADGSFTYTPDANFNGTDSFTYQANDGTADSNVATVTHHGRPRSTTRRWPATTATRTDEDTPLTVAAPGVLGNDTDVDGDALTAVLVSGPANGTLTLNADGSFTYTPDANFNGTDSFTYKASDGTADSNVATVTITVTPVNDAPVAGDDSYSTDEDTPLTVAAPGVLANDTDVDGDPLTAVAGQRPGPRHADAQRRRLVHLHAGRQLQRHRQLHLPGQRRQRRHQRRHRHAHRHRGQRRAGGRRRQLQHAPRTRRSTVAAPGVLGNDTDVDGDTLTAVLVSGPAHGTLTLNANGSLHATRRPPTTTAPTASPTRPATLAVPSPTWPPWSLTVTPPTLSINNVSANEGGLLQTHVLHLHRHPVEPDQPDDHGELRHRRRHGHGGDGSPWRRLQLHERHADFHGGQLTKTIVVTVNGDLIIEPNETFFVNLSNASTPLADNQGLGTIQNDDSGFLHVAGGEVVGASEAALTSEALAPIVTEAIARWAAAGVDESRWQPEQLRRPQSPTCRVRPSGPRPRTPSGSTWTPPATAGSSIRRRATTASSSCQATKASRAGWTC